MFRAINEYLAKINVVTDQSMYEAMSSFLEKTKLVDNFSINVVENKMKKYSVSAADKLYRKFISAIAYSYSQISVRYNEESRVRYRFASCKENKTGVYMDIIIAQA